VRYWYQGELLRLPAQLDLALQEANRRAEEERRGRVRAERLAEEEKRTREQAERPAEQEKRSREQAERRTEEERQARVALEQQIAQLQALLAQRPPGEGPRA
jgi:hypothetical protein